jgi:3-hydroxyisobutyrate dehydrogenase-like beta-hydroxyacid dehydrogenase
MIVAANIQAVADALTFVKAAGADPVRARQALLGGSRLPAFSMYTVLE